MKIENRKIWGVNQFGQIVREHDKLECGTLFSKWFTHVQFDVECNCWHREEDYYHFKVVGKYEN